MTRPEVGPPYTGGRVSGEITHGSWCQPTAHWQRGLGAERTVGAHSLRPGAAQRRHMWAPMAVSAGMCSEEHVHWHWRWRWHWQPCGGTVGPLRVTLAHQPLRQPGPHRRGHGLQRKRSLCLKLKPPHSPHTGGGSAAMERQRVSGTHMRCDHGDGVTGAGGCAQPHRGLTGGCRGGRPLHG
jgi:hypothetical protein